MPSAPITHAHAAIPAASGRGVSSAPGTSAPNGSAASKGSPRGGLEERRDEGPDEDREAQQERAERHRVTRAGRPVPQAVQQSRRQRADDEPLPKEVHDGRSEREPGG